MLENPSDILFVGKKPIMSYVNSAIIQLSSLPSITIKARGLSISFAVDVAQVLLRKTQIFAIGKIKLDSESMPSHDGKMRNVSTIEIPIVRSQ
ncbi:MAG: DNA-binding protein [Nitrosopumilaceae archaeon]|nr:DNA-binding protein [Nitrosopumilaceae archaeon]